MGKKKHVKKKQKKKNPATVNIPHVVELFNMFSNREYLNLSQIITYLEIKSFLYSLNSCGWCSYKSNMDNVPYHV